MFSFGYDEGMIDLANLLYIGLLARGEPAITIPHRYHPVGEGSEKMTNLDGEKDKFRTPPALCSPTSESLRTFTKIGCEYYKICKYIRN